MWEVEASGLSLAMFDFPPIPTLLLFSLAAAKGTCSSSTTRPSQRARPRHQIMTFIFSLFRRIHLINCGKEANSCTRQRGNSVSEKPHDRSLQRWFSCSRRDLQRFCCDRRDCCVIENLLKASIAFLILFLLYFFLQHDFFV